MAKKRGYKSVTLHLSKKRKIKLYTSNNVAKAYHEVLEKLETLYYGARLGLVFDAVRERGRRDGRAEVFEKLDALKQRLPHRLPGRPRRRT